MSTLLLRLAGPMQSWGTQSRFSVRDTGLEPSRSGVVGLLCAALGFPRAATEHAYQGTTIRFRDLAEPKALHMAVRVDREGRLARDYHTAGGEHRPGAVLGRDAKGKPIPYGVAKADSSARGTVVSSRYYLADADFLVGLQGGHALLETLDTALRHPIWPLYLGRKSFLPGCPIALGVRPDSAGDLEQVLKCYPWRKSFPREESPDRLRLVLEIPFGAGGPREDVPLEPRNDVPLSFAERRFTVRHVATSFCERIRDSAEELPCS
jgi:CRISPR system Cascade subunit CasD